MLAFPIQRGVKPKANATISVMGKSQLLVWGAAMSTLLRAWSGNAPSTVQPAVLKQSRDRTLNNAFKPMVVKMVLCIGAIMVPSDHRLSVPAVV